MREDFIYPRIDVDVPITDTLLEDLGKLLHEERLAPYIQNEIQTIKQDPLWQYARINFKNEDGGPWEMSPGEFYIFRTIARRETPRSQIVSATQYGKTITVSRALLVRITSYPEEWLVVPPDIKRGRKIMDYILKDCANNEYFAAKLIGMNLKEKNFMLKMMEERSKTKLTFQVYDKDRAIRHGSVEIINTSSKFKQIALESIMGFGGRNIIGEESALIDDEVESGIFRMLAGKGTDTFYLKIGNAFNRNHFLKSWKDKRYKKIFINDTIGLLEGRYTTEFLDEARGKPRYATLYEGKFPDQSEQDAKGWIPLLTDLEVRAAMQEAQHFGMEMIGVDVADSGTNHSVIVKRSTGYAEILFNKSGIDTMELAGHTVLQARDTNSGVCFIDRNGVGAGVFARVKEVNVNQYSSEMKIIGVNGADSPDDKVEFINKRAEMFWRVREWIKQGGKLAPNDAWYQLCEVRYKTADSSGAIQIMPKTVMLTQGIDSPDVADALSLTFYTKSKLQSRQGYKDPMKKKFDEWVRKDRDFPARSNQFYRDL